MVKLFRVRVLRSLATPQELSIRKLNSLVIRELTKNIKIFIKTGCREEFIAAGKLPNILIILEKKHLNDGSFAAF